MSDGEPLFAVAFMLYSLGVITGWLLGIWADRRMGRVSRQDQRMIERIKHKVEQIEKER